MITLAVACGMMYNDLATMQQKIQDNMENSLTQLRGEVNELNNRLDEAGRTCSVEIEMLKSINRSITYLEKKNEKFNKVNGLIIPTEHYFSFVNIYYYLV